MSFHGEPSTKQSNVDFQNDIDEVVDEEEPNSGSDAEELDDGVQCSICLQDYNDRTVIPECSHEFCFECILIWADQSRRCPLCTQTIGPYLIHNIRSNYDYQKYHLPPLRSSPPPIQPIRPVREPIRTSRRHTRQQRWGRKERREQEIADELERAIDKRRWVYHNHLYAKHVASNAFTRYRPYPPPALFASSPDQISRATVFIRRELRVWINLDVEFLTTFIISLMKAIDIRSESAIKLLAEFLDMDRSYVEGARFPNAEHFAHELYSYLRSPYRSLSTYDANVQYENPETPYRETSSTANQSFLYSFGRNRTSSRRGHLRSPSFHQVGGIRSRSPFSNRNSDGDVSQDISEERNAQQSKEKLNVGGAKLNHLAVDRAEETKEAYISLSSYDRSSSQVATKQLPAPDDLATNEAITTSSPPTVKEVGATNGEAIGTAETGLHSCNSDEKPNQSSNSHDSIKRSRRRDPLAVVRDYLGKASLSVEQTTPIKAQAQTASSSTICDGTSKDLPPRPSTANHARPTLLERLSVPQPMVMKQSPKLLSQSLRRSENDKESIKEGLRTKISQRIDSEKAQPFLSVADPKTERGTTEGKPDNADDTSVCNEGYGTEVVSSEASNAEAKLRMHLRLKKKLQQETAEQKRGKLGLENMTDKSNYESRAERLAESVGRENALKAILEQRGRKQTLLD